MGNATASSWRFREEQFLLEMQTMLETAGLQEDEDSFQYKPLQQMEASTDSFSQDLQVEDGGCRTIISSNTHTADVCRSKGCCSKCACLETTGVDKSGLTSSCLSKCHCGNEITPKTLLSFPSHSNMNNCANDGDKSASSSQSLNVKEDAISFMPHTRTDKADDAGALSKAGKIKGNKKRRRGLSIKYLSPHIERKATCSFQSEEQTGPRNDSNGTCFDDIRADSELSATPHRKLKAVDKVGQPGKENSFVSVKMAHLPKVKFLRRSEKVNTGVKQEENARERQKMDTDFQRNLLSDGTGRCRRVRKGSHKTDSTIAVEPSDNMGKNEARHALHNTDCMVDPVSRMSDQSDLLEDAEACVAEFLGTGEPGEFTFGPDDPMTRALTASDWEKVQQILDNLKKNDLGEIHPDDSESLDLNFLTNHAEGYGIGADLSYVEKELHAVAGVRATSGNPTQTHSEFWAGTRQKTVTEAAHSDSALKMLPSTFPQYHHFRKPSDPRHTHDQPPSHRKEKAAVEKCLRPCTPSSNSAASSIQRGFSLADNTNVSMSMEQGWSQDFGLWSHIPALRHQKWKCRSAPELRGLVQREEPVRRVSHLDLTISHVCDVNGPYVINVDSAEDQDALPSLMWGEEAYRHYRLLTLIELKEKIQLIKSAKAAIIKRYLRKQRVLQNIVDVAKAYYSNPTQKNRQEWKRLREEIKQSKTHSITDIRHTLAQIPDYPAIFTIFLMLAQVLSLVVMCSVGKLAPVGVLSEKRVQREIQTFLGAETLHRFIIPNPWIGPPVTTLLAAGATFAPCMRRDQHMAEEAAAHKFRKLDDTTFGCCQMRGSLNAAGTTTRDECSKYTNNAGAWGSPHCGKRLPGLNSVAHVIHPCCVDHRGTCQMLSHTHCNFLGGSFHLDKEHCVEVLCLQDVCKIGTNLFLFHPDPDRPWLAKKGTTWQWWRPLLALFYTFGILHCLPLLVLEWLLMRPLENNASCLRILATYTVSGVAGQLVASTTQPYIPQVGSTSGVAGIMGEAAVELSQAWTLLDKPHWEVVKLSGCLLLLLVMGLLPYVSLLGTLAGFGCGAVCALVFMPYIAFDVWSRVHKASMVITGLVLLVSLYGTLLYIYVQLQPHPCQPCRRLDCLSFADNMCNQWDLLG